MGSDLERCAEKDCRASRRAGRPPYFHSMKGSVCGRDVRRRQAIVLVRVLKTCLN